MDGRRWNKSAALRCSPRVRSDGPYPAASTTPPEAIPSAHHPCIVIGAHGLIAIILGPSAENPGAVRSRSRRSPPSADGQTQDVRHEEQRERLAARSEEHTSELQSRQYL